MASLRRLVAQRRLLLAMTERALRARYRGSALGVLWSFLNPLLLLAVYTLVFGFIYRPRLGALPDPYALFLFTGLLPWTWLATSLTEASQSIVDGGALLKKVAFPAETLPLTAVLANAAHFLLAAPILLVFLYFATPSFGPAAVAALAAVTIELLYAAGLALAVAALGLFYRDVRDILAHVLTLWFFTTPILYQLEGLPGALRQLIALNPLTPVFNAYQESLFFGRLPDWRPLAVSGLIGVAVLVGGYAIFEHYRDVMPEEV